MPTVENPTPVPLIEHGSLVTVIGESLVDVIHDPRRPGGPAVHPGGSPLNVAVGCARLDLSTTLVTHYADDPYGQLIDAHLVGNRVSTIVGGSSPTSTAVATLGADGAADYRFSITWDINGASIPALAAVENSLHVHTGSIATALPPGSKAVHGIIEAARGRASISYDPNCRPAISANLAEAREQAEDFVAASDFVKASDEDLAWLYPERTPEETAVAWLSLGPAFVALTRGAAGPVLRSRNDRNEVPGETVAVADTVGAGDSFMAGLISGLAQLGALGARNRESLYGLTGQQLQALAAYANRAAAITCSRPGANPPNVAELGALALPSPALEG